MLCLLAKTMCGRTQLTVPHADTEAGGRGPDPCPWKITSSIRLYRNMQWEPQPLKKNWTPWKCWTALLHGILESYSLMIVFFEKTLPLDQLCKISWGLTKNEEKNNVRAFFSKSGLDPSLPHRETRQKFLDPRMVIRYCGGWESIWLIKPSTCRLAKVRTFACSLICQKGKT